MEPTPVPPTIPIVPYVPPKPDNTDTSAAADDTEAQTECTGEFRLAYEPHGVFLTLSCSRPITLTEQERLVRHLSRKKIKELNMQAVLDAVTNTSPEALYIAPAQPETVYDEAFTAALSTDMMSASITLSPPEPEKGARLTVEEVVRALDTKYHVTYGIDEAAIIALLQDPVYETPVVIARGTPAVAGKDGCLAYHFRQRTGQEGYKIRQVEEDQKADYKNLDLFEHVAKDQVLVTRIPPEEGIPGATVMGRAVPAEPGKNYLLPRGKNTYVSANSMDLISSIAGRVEEVAGCVGICNFYVVPGDVDMSVGNIDFDGDITVNGNVLSGFSLKATGSIEVKGIVEASALEAGGDVLIRGGIQGGGKANITAKEGVYVRFAEYATISATSFVTAESLLHTNVRCFGPVEVLDGRGSIIGGNICAGTYIAAHYLGTPSGRTTELQAGLSPSHRMKVAEMEAAVAVLKKETERLQEVIQATPSTTPKNSREQTVRMENVRKLLQCKKMLQDESDALLDIKGHLEEKRSGQIHVLHTAYPGVSIFIGLARMTVAQQTTFATFRLDDGMIQFTNCRFKQQPIRPKKRRR